jgi:membrane associated rhomboid family serine protease
MSITLILIIITSGISYYAFSNTLLMDKLIMNPYRVTKRNEYYRFITSGFIHADFGHLIFNMLSLCISLVSLSQIFRHF